MLIRKFSKIQFQRSSVLDEISQGLSIDQEIQSYTSSRVFGQIFLNFWKPFKIGREMIWKRLVSTILFQFIVFTLLISWKIQIFSDKHLLPCFYQSETRPHAFDALLQRNGNRSFFIDSLHVHKWEGLRGGRF